MNERMNVLIRVDAGPRIGLGHLQRCLSLALSLRRQGADCVFLTNREPTVGDRVARFGFKGVALQALESWGPEDISQAIAVASEHRCRAVVVDSDEEGAPYLVRLRDRGFFVCALEDTNPHPFPCQMVVNGDAGAEVIPYRSATGEASFLLGVQYALLKPEFWKVPSRVVRPRVRNLLVIFGGTDPFRLMPDLLKLLDDCPGTFTVTAVVGPFFQNVSEIQSIADGAHRSVKLVHSPDSVRDLMEEADVAISAAGQTLYELARVGTPTVAFSAASNQEGQLKALAEAGCVRSIRDARRADLLPRVRDAIVWLLDDPAARAKMAEIGQGLVDGQGAFRVARAILKTSGTQSSPPVFLENLGVGLLIRSVISCFLGKGPLGRSREIFVIYKLTWVARRLAGLLKSFRFRIAVRELDYDFFDDVQLPGKPRAVDEFYFHAPPRLLRRIESNPAYASAVRHGCQRPSHARYLKAYLSKKIFFQVTERVRSVLVAAWYSQRKQPGPVSKAHLYLPEDWLFPLLSEYARELCVRLEPLPAAWIRWEDFLSPLKGFFRRILYGWKNLLLRDHRHPPRVAVEMYLNGIRKEKIWNTDLFWYREPRLPQDRIFAYFPHPQDQPTSPRRAVLRQQGIGWVDQSLLRQWMVPPRFRGNLLLRRDGSGSRTVTPHRGDRFQRLLADSIRDFYAERGRWLRFFKATGTRIHVSTTDHFPESEALHAAMEDAGGVSISIQRSIEREPRRFRQTVVDVHFGFSQEGALTEELSGSFVRQFLVSGYLFDDVFPEAREAAKQLASGLRSRGAEFILCFLDENKGVVPKSVGGGRQMRADYLFLCDRLSEDETLGLILKPKRPETLPERLGPAWPRLKGFIDSGRCLFLGGKPPDERYLPCVGAAAADMAVNLLDGATAGLESYLAGTRTLLLGRGQDRGIFKELPEGSVVFDSWTDLWQALSRFRSHPGHPTIGNWEPIIDRLVLLRDGRTSERILEYILWLYEAFLQGSSREEALAFAGERYAKKWGDRMIRQIPQGRPAEVSSENSSNEASHRVTSIEG